MASQNNPGRQADQQHAVTIVATADLVANRIVGYDGGYATSAGTVHDAQGVSQSAAATGQALALTTRYSELVECSAPIAFGAYIKPAADGTGRAAAGTLTDHCGRALGATTAIGQLVEMEIKPHVHA
ncbi:MAG: DUF2190 domain-containing protein [Burkholderiaceae bacterium]|nr:DUF2190 domain-containing protein [Burkholderiaceae bacterium]